MQQRPLRSALAAGHYLEVFQGDGVDDEAVAARPVPDGADMSEVGFLRIAQIGDQGPRRLDGRRSPFEPEAFESVSLELVEQCATCGLLLETPAVSRRHDRLDLRHCHDLFDNRRLLVARHDDFARAEHGDLVRQCADARGAVILRRAELARGEVDQGGAEDRFLRFDRRNRHQERRFPCVEIAGIGKRSRRDDPDDFTPHQPLGLLGILDLLANRDAKSFPDQPRDVAVGRVKGDAAHRDAIAAGVLRSGRQRQFECARRHERVLVEHLVEVAHPEEHDRIAVLTLGVEVLPHRGRCTGGLGHIRRWFSAPGSRPNYYPSMVILALDTTTAAGSCALAVDGVVTREEGSDASLPPATRLPLDLMTLLEHADLTLGAIDAFAVAIGPGRSPGFA